MCYVRFACSHYGPNDHLYEVDRKAIRSCWVTLTCHANSHMTRHLRKLRHWNDAWDAMHDYPYDPDEENEAENGGGDSYDKSVHGARFPLGMVVSAVTPGSVASFVSSPVTFLGRIFGFGDSASESPG